MTSKRISDLLGSRPHKLQIKDYAKINEIFNLYLDQKYDTMAREIYWYRASEFWVAIQLYLLKHFKYEYRRIFHKRDIEEKYFEREISVLYENELKKERKKHRL